MNKLSKESIELLTAELDKRKKQIQELINKRNEMNVTIVKSQGEVEGLERLIKVNNNGKD